MDINTLVENHRTANPFVIADNLNISYIFVDFPARLKGRIIVTHDGEPIILLNNSLKNSKEKYLVMAHELKHAMDHSDLIGYYSLCYGGKGKLELEANKFATDLMILLYQEQYQIIPDTFDKLISVYGVKEEMREYY
mgnify:FL=1